MARAGTIRETINVECPVCGEWVGVPVSMSPRDYDLATGAALWLATTVHLGELRTHARAHQVAACHACYAPTVALDRGEQVRLDAVRSWHDLGRGIARDYERAARAVVRLAERIDRWMWGPRL